MEDGEIGIYQNAAGVILCSIRQGDTGIPFERLLPPEMRGAAFSDAPIRAFANCSYLFFATSKQWEEWWRDIPAGTHVTKPQPPLDVTALRLENDTGNIDYDRLIGLFSLIWPHWRTPPPLGMIAYLIERDVPFEQISEYLALYARYGDKIKDLDRCFMEIFLPPDSADDILLGNDQIEHALRWCRRPDGGDELKQEELLWTLNFRELGIVGSDGRLNRHIAAKARDFIWDDPDREPDYFALKAHLEPFLPAQAQSATKAQNKPLPKAYRNKLKKQKRKAGRIRRRR